MPTIEITSVTLLGNDQPELIAYSLDVPSLGSVFEGYTLNIGGWAIGRTERVRSIEIVYLGMPIRRSPINLDRPDVEAHFSGTGIINTLRSGFWTTIGLVSMASEFEILISVIMANLQRVPLATIRGRHSPVKSSFIPAYNPIMVTSLGRTGTTLLMQLLAEHPEIVAQRIHPYETRIANYWMHTFRVLAEPANHHESSHPDKFYENPLMIGHNPFHLEPTNLSPPIQRWFSQTFIEQLAAFCQQSIEGFYQQVVISQNEPPPRFFVEKCAADTIPRILWQFYPGAKEIILVRDFRDMICSMLAFDIKRNNNNFQRESVNDPEGFIKNNRDDIARLLHSWRERSHQALFLRYEELVQSPLETMQKVFGYLEVDNSLSTLHRILDNTLMESAETLKHRTSQSLASSIGRWKQDLSLPLQQMCQEILGDFLLETGYEL